MQRTLLFTGLLWTGFLLACQRQPQQPANPEPVISAPEPMDTSHPEFKLRQAGLIPIDELDSTIRVQLAYSTDDNFLGRDVYGALERAFLLAEASGMLATAQYFLKRRLPDHSLLVWDAARPLSVQRKMWDLVKDTDQQRYVASPDKGSMHNYGAAVDLTIVDSKGQPLDMGTAFDHFGPEAQTRYDDKHLRSGVLTRAQVDNRKLLREIMIQAGFSPILTEWWHFNAMDKEFVRGNYGMLE